MATIIDEAALRNDPRLHVYRAIFNTIYTDNKKARSELGRFLFYTYTNGVPRDDHTVRNLYRDFCNTHGIYYSNRSTRTHVQDVYPHVGISMFEATENYRQFAPELIEDLAGQYKREIQRHGQKAAAIGLRRRILSDAALDVLFDEMHGRRSYLYLLLTWPALRLTGGKNPSIGVSSTSVRVYTKDRVLAPWMADPDQLIRRLEDVKADVQLIRVADTARQLLRSSMKYAQNDYAQAADHPLFYDVRDYESRVNKLQKALNALTISYGKTTCGLVDIGSSVRPTEAEVAHVGAPAIDTVVQTVEAEPEMQPDLIVNRTAQTEPAVSSMPRADDEKLNPLAASCVDTRYMELNEASIENQFLQILKDFKQMVSVRWDDIKQVFDTLAPQTIDDLYRRSKRYLGHKDQRPCHICVLGKYLHLTYVERGLERRVKALIIDTKTVENGEE